VALSRLLIAATGADLSCTINDDYYPPWRSILLKKGDQIYFKRRRSGLRAYLTVQGGFKAATFLGSGSVFQRGSMGRSLRKDDILEVTNAPQELFIASSVPESYLPKAVAPWVVRVILGPQTETFTSEGLDTFVNSSYRIKPESDRMAYRLDGPRIAHRERADIISEPVIPGSIQIPSEGLPIVLMADGQVTGGYAKIANVISADLSVLAQAMPGESVRFMPVDLDQAYQFIEEREQLLVWLRRNS
jgi:antagonist of KipI